MIDYQTVETTSAEPDASSMIETFRAIGYSVESAVADLIDNSVAAGARNIWINYTWKGPETVFSIKDDGCGMCNDELVQAMKPGSINPREQRHETDLGRFGLGLKTASFSQCRKFTVFSMKSDSEASYWCWDLDYVNCEKKWKIIRLCPAKEYFSNKLSELWHGTIVIWWDIDRLTADTKADDERSKKNFLITMDRVKKHLSMVFHRYIDDGFNVFFQERRIEPWDPFMLGYEGLQAKPETVMENGKVRIKGFVLPHRSKLSPEAYNYGKGPRDNWTSHQGFYIYRNRRLLVAGDWLGIFKKEVHYDLCRILIDLPNNMDHEWQLDIKKSVARPPSRLREAILSVAKEVRAQALEVYRHKGKVVKRRLLQNEFYPLWEERTRHGKRFYKLNRNHPLLKELLKSTPDFSSQLEKMLQFIEETVPVPLITLQENENEKPHGQPFEGKSHDVIKDTMIAMYSNLISQGKSDEQAKSLIMNIEPFNFYPEYFEYLE
ncbi:MAG: ATP-binding protein [Thermodesulfobacteriota bacterium]|nr:ATP-binding protein [Thermodesulfobacteriota bacterium]